MKKSLILLWALTIVLGTAALACATTITFEEFWTDPPQFSRTLVGNEWSSYGINTSGAYWYADTRDPFDTHGIANNTGAAATISFLMPTNAVTFDWAAINSQTIYVDAYNASNVLLDTFFQSGTGTFSGTNTVTGSGIAYITFHDSGGAIGISTLDFNPVPEPATMLLLGTGLVGVAGAARRKKKNQA